MRGHRADHQVVALVADAVQAGRPVQVHHHVRVGQPQRNKAEELSKRHFRRVVQALRDLAQTRECELLRAPRPRAWSATSPAEDTCPICGRQTRRTPDVIDEMVEAVIGESGLTRHVATDAGLSEYIVAAELRFPLPPPADGQ